MFKRLLILSILFVGLVGGSLAQKTLDERLAAQYFSSEEYEKAVIYYEKIFEKTKSKSYYSRLLECYQKVGDQKKGEKLIRKQLKRQPFQLGYLVDLADLYEFFEDDLKARQTSEKAIKMLSPSTSQVINLAKAFLKYKKTKYAIATYSKGRKLLRDDYPFNYELAEVYNLEGRTEDMLNEYLSLLAFNESYIQSVQNALQTNLNPDEKGEKKAMLKSLLIRNIQRYPNRKVYPEMLIWLYIQEKNFAGAFLQTKALDKRLMEGGVRIFSLAELSRSNRDYETAIDCYQYIIDLGISNSNYTASKMKLVAVYNEKIVESNKYSEEDILNLEKTYLSTLSELGYNTTTASLIRGLAHLHAFYMDDIPQAIEALKEMIKMPRLSMHQSAEGKLDLADIYLLHGEIWEASLLYSQVEKSFKYDQLGEKAKFKNAKISFYTGDFGWAKAQLDVLKASTSKLISNDAMQLSILITDNIGIDTTEAPLLMFAKADLLAFQNKFEQAEEVLDSLHFLYPVHSISDDILYKKYEINYQQKKFTRASENLKEIIENYSQDILADDAMYHLAVLMDNQLGQQEVASKLYKQLMVNYQGSIYVVDARKRYRELNNEIKIIEINENYLKFQTN